MKTKILLTVMGVCFSVASTFAQINKGTVLVGGSLGMSLSSDHGYNSTFTQDTKEQFYLVRPSVGIAVKQNMVVGALLHYGHNKTTDPGYFYSNNNDYGLGMFVRGYKNLGKGFYAFAQLNAGGRYARRESHYTAQLDYYISRSREVRVSLYPGIAYTITRRIQIEAGYYDIGYLSYTRTKINSSQGTLTTATRSSFLLGSSVSNLGGITLGIQFLLN